MRDDLATLDLGLRLVEHPAEFEGIEAVHQTLVNTDIHEHGGVVAVLGQDERPLCLLNVMDGRRDLCAKVRDWQRVADRGPQRSHVHDAPPVAMYRTLYRIARTRIEGEPRQG